MIRNFENIKKQLQELTPVINAFKSEAVQVKIVELLLTTASRADAANAPAPSPAAGKTAKPVPVATTKAVAKAAVQDSKKRVGRPAAAKKADAPAPASQAAPVPAAAASKSPAPKKSGKKPVKATGAKKQKAPRKNSGLGSAATLTQLIENGYFAEDRTIGDVIAHSEKALGRSFKASEFSGQLLARVNRKILKRRKNDAGQYVYARAK